MYSGVYINIYKSQNHPNGHPTVVFWLFVCLGYQMMPDGDLKGARVPTDPTTQKRLMNKFRVTIIVSKRHEREDHFQT